MEMLFVLPAKAQSRKEDEILRREAPVERLNCACGAGRSLLCGFAPLRAKRNSVETRA